VPLHQWPELGAVVAHRLRPYSGVRGLADGAGAAAHRGALEPRPKPGPYRPVESEAAATDGHRPVLDPGPTGPHGSGPEQPDEGVLVSARTREA